MSLDMSMTPAPFTPTIPGHTAHSRAEDHASPPPDSAASIRCSLSPAISATQPRAQIRPSARSIREIIHLPAPSAEKGKRQQGLDSTPFRARPAGALLTNATPKKGQKAARTRPVDNPQPRGNVRADG